MVTADERDFHVPLDLDLLRLHSLTIIFLLSLATSFRSPEYCSTTGLTVRTAADDTYSFQSPFLASNLRSLTIDDFMDVLCCEEWMIQVVPHKRAVRILLIGVAETRCENTPA